MSARNAVFHFLVLLSIAPIQANAMTFEVLNVGGEPAIIGSGEIVSGDAKRLNTVLTSEARHSHGYFSLALNSPGGSVKAAFEMSQIIDAHNVNTYIPPGFECVSACAAIVFIAGREHVVVAGGRLGFHGCYNAQTKELLSLCNEQIAQHALNHGTAYGSVMAFIQNVPYDQVVWFDDKDADCWAITRFLISPQPPNFEQCVFDAIRNANK